MKRPQIFLAAILACAVGAAGVASAADAGPAAHAAGGSMVRTRHTSLGTILVSASGHTLYAFTRDHTRSNSCQSIGKCPHVWPALQSSGKPIAGPGVKASLLSTITLKSGGKQITYAGHALYLYSGDTGAGETGYVGANEFGGVWDAVNGSGRLLK
jgi:predicted lipoprotein with Yx(FWY)xxD motif